METIVKMTINNILIYSILISVILMSSCKKERILNDFNESEKFDFRVLDSTGTTTFFSIKVDNYSFKNASDSVEYGIIYNYIDKYGFELNKIQKKGTFLGSLTLNDTIEFDYPSVPVDALPSLKAQFYCSYNGVYEKSIKIKVIQSSFFKIIANHGSLPLVNPFVNSWSSVTQAFQGDYISYYEYPKVYFYSSDFFNPGYKSFDIQTNSLSSSVPNLYINYYNSSNYDYSAKLFKVGTKQVIRRDSVYNSGIAYNRGFISILDFPNNRLDLTGPNFPSSHFYQNIESQGSRKTLQSLFWFDFGTYAHVMLAGFNSSIAGATAITKFIKFNGTTEQFENIESIPVDAQTTIDQSITSTNSFTTFNNIGYVCIGNKIYTYNPTASNKWNVFQGIVEGGVSLFIPFQGTLYFVTSAYVYKLDNNLTTMKGYKNSYSKVQYMISFPYFENSELKSKIYGDSAAVGTQYQFTP